jgi:hypothetical protein
MVDLWEDLSTTASMICSIIRAAYRSLKPLRIAEYRIQFAMCVHALHSVAKFLKMFPAIRSCRFVVKFGFGSYKYTHLTA